MNNKFTIRFPSQQALPIHSEEVKFWDDRIAALSDLLTKNNYNINNSTGDIQIRLASSDRGIHNHNKKSEAFAWFGMPTPGELMKAISVVVGIQVKDYAVHIPATSRFNETDKFIVKPNILYLPDDTPNLEKNSYKILHDQIKVMIDAGTIGKADTIDKLFKIVKTPEEFVDALHKQTPIKQSIHTENHIEVNINPEILKIGEHILDATVKKPEFCGIVYTSANPNQSKEAIKQAQLLGKLMAESNVGLITGAGASELCYCTA